jgi:hypothetical protein
MKERRDVVATLLFYLAVLRSSNAKCESEHRSHARRKNAAEGEVRGT